MQDENLGLLFEFKHSLHINQLGQEVVQIDGPVRHINYYIF